MGNISIFFNNIQEITKIYAVKWLGLAEFYKRTCGTGSYRGISSKFKKQLFVNPKPDILTEITVTYPFWQ